MKAIEPTIHDTGIGETFVGLIIVPALGNIAEHLSAVRIAWRGNIDFSMGIVFNSGLQVALFITAAAVLAGTVLGHDVTVVFPPLELAVLGAAAVMAAFVTADGEATWIEGLELVAIYILAGALVLVPRRSHASAGPLDERARATRAARPRARRPPPSTRRHPRAARASAGSASRGPLARDATRPASASAARCFETA